MISRRSKKRTIWVVSAALFWLAIGLSAPLIFDFSGDDIQVDSANVVAATSNRYKLSEALVLDRKSGARLSGGTLSLAVAKNERISAKNAAEMLAAGKAVLMLQDGALSLGEALDTSTNSTDQKAPLVKALTQGRFKALLVRNGAVIVTLPKKRQERLSKVNMRLVANGSGGAEAKGTGYWRGQKVKFSLQSQPTSAKSELSVKLSFDATLINIAYEGTYRIGDKPSLSGQTKLHLKSVDKLARAMGSAWPISTNINDIRVEGPLRWESEVLSVDQANVKVDANEAKGTISLNTKDQAVIVGTLAFDTFDLTALRPQNVNAPSLQPIHHWWNGFMARLSGQSDQHINADIRLSTKKLMAGKKAFGSAAATVSLRNGTLSADVAEVMLNEGRMTGQFSVDFKRYIPKFALRGQLENIAFGQWSEKLTGKRHIEGVGRLFADFTSQGTHLEQVINEISGRLEMSIPEAGTVSVSAAELNAVGTKNSSLAPKELFKKSIKGSTRVSSLTAAWQFEDGVGQLLDASAKHSLGLLRGRGTYDIARGIYDVRLLSVASPADGAITSGTSASAGANPKLESKAVPRPGVLLRLRSAPRNVLQQQGASPIVNVHSLTAPLEDLELLLGSSKQKPPRRGL